MAKRWILFSLTSREFGKDGRNRFIVHDGPNPPALEDWPRGFHPYKGGWSFAEVTETVTDANHKGAATYRQPDYQVARITKIVGPKPHKEKTKI
jgi:hypothetical protein